MPAIKHDRLLLRMLKDLQDVRSALRRVTTNLPLYDINNENTPDQIMSDQDDYVPGNYDILRISSDATGRTITGFRGGVKGRYLRIFNVGSYEMILSHQDASSDPENRIVSPTGFDIIINADGEISLYYDEAVSRWIASYSSNANRISAEIQISSDQSIANAVYTSINWNNKITDTGGFYNTTDTNFVRIPETGWYYAHAVIVWAVNGTNLREVLMDEFSGTDSVVWDSRLAVSNAQTVISLPTMFYREEGDLIEVKVWQNSGGALDILQDRGGSFALKTRFKIVKM